VILSVKNLNILFKDAVFVEDLNFQINNSEIFSIAGESGSGKTLTALSLINLLPDFFRAKGEIIFNNQNLLGLSLEEIRKIRGRHISFIFQDPMVSLNPVMRVGLQVAEMFIYHYGMKKGEALVKAREIFDKLRIAHVLESYPHQLSGGMRQRVMIAMAIACNAELIIADEPTTALDVTVQEEILDLLYLLVKEEKKALILITHDINLIGEYADRVMIMYAGKVMEMGAVEEIYKNPLHPYTKALLDCFPEEGKKIRAIPGNIPHLRKIPKGCSFHPRCADKREDCSIVEPSLVELKPGHWVRCLRS